MRVSDVRVHKKIQRDTFYTLVPLNFVLKLVGLNCISRDGSILKYAWSSPKTIVLILLFSAMNIFNLYNKLYVWKGRVSFQFIDVIQVMFLFSYFQYLVDIYYVYKYGRSKALHYFNIYGNIDKVLRINNYKEIRNCINILLISYGFVTLITAAIELFGWFVSYGPAVIVAYIMDYFYVIVRNFSFADIIAQVTQVSFRLRAMGDILKGFYLVTETLPGEKDIVVDKWLGGYVVRDGTKDSGTIHPDSVKTIDQTNNVLMIKKLNGCYLLILELSDYINTMYGVRILGMCVTTFIDVTVELNMTFRLAMGSMVTTYSSGVLLMLSSLVRVLSIAFVLFYGVYSCEKCYSQINRIIRYIDCLLNNKNISVDTRETLMNLRSMVMSRPVRFHAVSFYKLDFALLLSFGSTVVTYTIILLQNLQ